MTVDKKFLTIDNKIETLREMRVRANASIVADFDEKLDVSWIYHDNALEGVVLSYHELKAAIDKKIISDVTLIPMYEEIKNHKASIEMVRQMARGWAVERHNNKKKRRNEITTTAQNGTRAKATIPQEKAMAAMRQRGPTASSGGVVRAPVAKRRRAR